MADRKLIVAIVGDADSLVREFKRSSSAAGKFDRDMARSSNRVSNSFTKMQKLAAGGFIGGVVATQALRFLEATSKAAAESQQVLGQTRVALQSTGKSWSTYGKRIEDVIAAQSRLGFDDEALLRTFSMFVRRTGDVEQALGDNALAMDVARARFIDLEQAANLVNKAALGQAGALRRLGIDTGKLKDGTQLLALLTEKYGGSAKSASKDASTAFERVTVSSENLQESIGTLTQPFVTELATGLADAAEMAALLVKGLQGLGQVRIPPIKIPLTTVEVPGTGISVGDLFGKATGVGKFVPVLNPLFGASWAKAIADQFDSQTKAAAPGLRFRFGKSLEDMIAYATKQPPLKPAADFAKLPGIDTGTPLANDFGAAVDKFMDVAKGKIADAIRRGKAAIAKAAAEAAAEERSKAFAKALAAFQLGVDKAALTKSLRDDLQALQAYKAGLQKQIKAGVDIQSAQSQLVSVVGQIADKQKEIAQAASDAVQARQFRALGLGPTGGPLVPTIANLLKQFESLGDRLKGHTISSKLRSAFQNVGKILSGSMGKVTDDVKLAIVNLFDEIRATFGDQSKNLNLRATSGLNTKKIVEGLGLSPELERIIRARLSHVNTRGMSLSGQTAQAIAVAGVPVVESHVTIQMDSDVVAKHVTKSQQKTRRRNPPQKRGPNSGV